MLFGFFGERTPGVTLLISGITAIPCGVFIANMITSPDARAACDIAAANWEAGNRYSEANRVTGPTQLAEQYNVYRKACPSGYKHVDESRISADVKAGYSPAKN